MTDAWEEGFDSWTPRREAGDIEDTDTDLQRAELLRLARELAVRHEPVSSDDELEALKRSLRERAEAVAERERELERLQRKVDSGRSFFRRPAPDDEAVAARERATLERAQALDARERETDARAVALAAEAAQLAEREAQLTSGLVETEAERELAAREREQLEERDRAAHDVERSLAAMRIALEERERELEARAAALAAAARAEVEHEAQIEHATSARTDAVEQREQDLQAQEERLAARERELLLIRQGIDADRNALLERERALRRREIAEVRESFGPPLQPPSFSEGLAAFARLRSRS